MIDNNKRDESQACIATHTKHTNGFHGVGFTNVFIKL